MQALANQGQSGSGMEITKVSRRLFRGPTRTFVVFPLVTLMAELALRGGKLKIEPLFLILMIWGYLQTRLCGRYRINHGGGGPGMDTLPERLVATGPYAFTRNPIYLGHVIFMAGLSLFLSSIFAGLLTAAIIVQFHSRVRADEGRLAKLFGQPYLDYKKTVKRWVPGVL
jgi:hypothetical protein